MNSGKILNLQLSEFSTVAEVKNAVNMAHGARVTSLTQDLARGTLSGASVDKFTRLALLTFANASPGRTNQFAVNARLEGLEEKARILNNDPLADALHDRLHELSERSDRWTPELLSLLLELSDRPLHETRLESLTLLRPKSSPAPLTWSDILADDPLGDDDNLWENIDFRDCESDETGEFESKSVDEIIERPTHSTASDFEATDGSAVQFVDSRDHEQLQQIAQNQFWRNKHDGNFESDRGQDLDQSGVLLTEKQAVREVTFMLLGLPTSIYTISQTGQIALSQAVNLRHVSQQATTALLESFGEIGMRLSNVRQWIRRKTDTPLEQTFQTSLASRIKEVETSLNEAQARLIDNSSEPHLSILGLHEEVSISSRLVQQTDEILVDVEKFTGSALSIRILEKLFDTACNSQAIGDPDAYEYMVRMFFDCFRTYLRPIRLWVEQGFLDSRDMVIFIEENQEDVPLSSLWQRKFHLVNDVNGKMHAPTFLHFASKKILNSGKSVDFLRHLGHEADPNHVTLYSETSMSFEDVCRPADSMSLSPFSVLFDVAFERWVANVHHLSSSILRQYLDVEFGLQKSIDALEYIYFCSDSALGSIFTLSLFERMERGHCGWNSSLTLTELIQNTYRLIPCIDVEQIEVRTRTKTLNHESKHVRRPMAVLDEIRIHYDLPWPVANIIKSDSIEVYQRIFVLLLQFQRAKYLLQRQKLKNDFQPAANKVLLLLYAVRHRLLWFVNTILTYLTQVVLSATTARMRSSMRFAVDMDGMIEVHQTYIARLKHQCFLAKQHTSLHQAIVSLLDITVLYSDVETKYVRPIGSTADILNTTFSLLSQYSSDDSDSEADPQRIESPAITAPSDTERLSQMNDTFFKLLTFVVAAVQGVSKADSAPCWEILASSFAAGPA